MNNKNFAIYALCTIFLFQPLHGSEGQDSPSFGFFCAKTTAQFILSKIRNAIDRSIDNINRSIIDINQEVRFARYTNISEIMASDLPEKVDDKIKAIINQNYTDPKQPEISFDIFATPESKIFVLKNMQDFFKFRPEHKDLNMLIYKECNKQINKLESSYRNNQQNDFIKSIDKARYEYMQQYGISVTALNQMSYLNEKIENIADALKQLINEARQRNCINDRENDAQFRALLSIFAHLIYKKNQNKQSMFVEQEMKTLQEEIQKKAQEKTALLESAYREASKKEMVGIKIEGPSFGRASLDPAFVKTLIPLKEAQAREKKRLNEETNQRATQLKQAQLYEDWKKRTTQEISSQQNIFSRIWSTIKAWWY